MTTTHIWPIRALRRLASAKHLLLMATLLSLIGSAWHTNTAAAAGESYAWSGNNIRAIGGIFSPTPGSGTTFTAVNAPAGSKEFVYNSPALTSTLGGDPAAPACNTARYRIVVTVADPGKSNNYTAQISRFGPGGCGPLLSGQVLLVGDPPTTVVPPVAPPSTGNDAQNEDEDLCTSPSGELGWVICPMTSFFMEGAIALDDAIVNNFLDLDTESIFGGPAAGDKESSAAFHKAHGAFRNIAYALLILLGLVMVVSQIIGLDIVDAYTLRKMLPKIFFVALCLPLLWPGLGFLFNLANDSADAVQQILRAPFMNIGKTVGGNDILGGVGAIAGILAAGGGIVALLALGGSAMAIILPLVGGLLLAVASAFLIMAVRDILAGGLVIVSPLLVVAAAFGPTAGVAKFGRRMGTTMLLSVPAGAGLLMLSKDLSVMALLAKGVWSIPLAWLFIGAGYGLFWKTIKRIDQVTAQLDQGVSGLTAGTRKWLAKKRQQGVAENAQRAGSWVTQKRAVAYQRAKSRADRSGGVRAGLHRGWARMVGGYNAEAKASATRAAQAKEINDQIATGRDEEIRGLTVDIRQLDDFQGAVARGEAREENGVRQYKSLGGAWVNESDVIEGHRRWKGDAYAQQAALSYEMRKSGSEEEVKHLAENYGRVATGAWGMNDIDAGGAWIGAAFENQNTHLQFKSMRWQTGELNNPDRLVDEIYERRGSYNLAQMAPGTIRSLMEAFQNAAPTAGDSPEVAQKKLDRQQKIAAIAETFMQSTGYGGQMGQIGQVDQGGQNVPIQGPPVQLPAGQQVQIQQQAQPPRQAYVPGSAHVAENIVDLAELTRTLYQAPTGNYQMPGAGAPAAGAPGPAPPVGTQSHGVAQTHRDQKSRPGPPPVGVAPP